MESFPYKFLPFFVENSYVISEKLLNPFPWFDMNRSYLQVHDDSRATGWIRLGQTGRSRTDIFAQVLGVPYIVSNFHATRFIL